MGGGSSNIPMPTPAAVAAILADRPSLSAAAATAPQRTNSTDYHHKGGNFESSPSVLHLPQTPISQGA